MADGWLLMTPGLTALLLLLPLGYVKDQAPD